MQSLEQPDAFSDVTEGIMCLFLYHHKLKLLLSSSLLSVADNYQSKLHQSWKEKMLLTSIAKTLNPVVLGWQNFTRESLCLLLNLHLDMAELEF